MATTTGTQQPQLASPIAMATQRSLSKRLVINLLVVLTAVLTVSGLILYLSIRKQLYYEFDQSLADRAASYSLFTEQDVEGLVFEWEEHNEKPESKRRFECFQMWLPDGSSPAKSDSLIDSALPRMSDLKTEQAKYINFTLPNGEPGRAIGIAFFASREENVPPEVSPIAIELVVARSLLDIHSALAILRKTLTAIWLAAIILSGLSMRWVVKRACRPLLVLSQRIQEFDDSHLRHQLNTDHIPTEVVPVVNRFNGLLKRLAKAFEKEKQLTANIAHELRTPLSGLRTSLEVAISRPREADEHVEIERECLQITCQLQGLVENVLLLAKLEVGSVVKQTREVDLIHLMRQCWPLYAQHAQERALGITWDAPEPCSIHTAPDLLRMVISNLFNNAVTYATAGSTIHVRADVEGLWLKISIVNDVEGVTPQHVQHAFDPFWRSDVARASIGTNAGLGLSLCQKLMVVLGGTIELFYDEGKVFRVELRIVNEPPNTVIDSTFQTTRMN